MAKTELAQRKRLLKERETRIESAVTHAFVVAGQELRAIRDDKLYKSPAGFESFEDYCRVRWQFEKTHVYQLIAASEVLDNLSIRHGGVLPANERIARELTPLLPEPPVMQEAWTVAVDTAPKEGEQPVITAKHVKAVVRKYIHKEEPDRFPGTGYRVLYADPPWKYRDDMIEGYGAVVHHYTPMTIDELCQMTDTAGVPVQELPAEEAVLFMWVTSPKLDECWDVMQAWGFQYRTSFVWDKVHHNYGHYNSVRHELLLIATRGSCTPDSKTLHDSVVTIERTKTHSEKPERFREIIDEMYPPDKEAEPDRVELFTRKELPAWWHGYGHQRPS